MNQDTFDKERLNPFPEPTLLSWLEDYRDQLDCPIPLLTGDTLENLNVLS